MSTHVTLSFTIIAPHKQEVSAPNGARYMGHNLAQEGFLEPMNLLKVYAEFCVTMHFFLERTSTAFIRLSNMKVISPKVEPLSRNL